MKNGVNNFSFNIFLQTLNFGGLMGMVIKYYITFFDSETDDQLEQREEKLEFVM